MFAISRQWPSRLWPAFTIAVIAALMLAATASAASPIAHTVKTGGPDACIDMGDTIGCDGNFSFSAFLLADGTATGRYTDRFAGGNGIHGVIDCVVVDGNEAWISGVVTQGSFEGDDLAGLAFTVKVVDNGANGVDQISTSHTGDETSCLEQTEFELFDVTQGNVIVK